MMDPNDENQKKMMEEIMEKKIRKAIKQKWLLDPTNTVIEPLFTKETLEYPNPMKLKPLAISLYNSTKDPIDHVQTCQSYMHYVGASNALMYRAFPIIFRMATWDQYATLKPNSIGLFKEFTP